MALPMASGPAAPGKSLCPASLGMQKTRSCFQHRLPQSKQGAGPAAPAQTALPPGSTLLGRDRKALEAGSTLALLSPAPIPPATFLLPPPQGRGVPSPHIPPLVPRSCSCPGTHLPPCPRMLPASRGAAGGAALSCCLKGSSVLRPRSWGRSHFVFSCTQAQDSLLSSATSSLRASVSPSWEMTETPQHEGAGGGGSRAQALCQGGDAPWGSAPRYPIKPRDEPPARPAEGRAEQQRELLQQPNS